MKCERCNQEMTDGSYLSPQWYGDKFLPAARAWRCEACDHDHFEAVEYRGEMLYTYSPMAAYVASVCCAD